LESVIDIFDKIYDYWKKFKEWQVSWNSFSIDRPAATSSVANKWTEGCRCLGAL